MTDLKALLANVDSGRRLENITLAAGEIKKIFSEDSKIVRHTLWVFNKSTTDDIVLLSSDNKTGIGITIRKDSDRSFEYHLVALFQDPDDPNIVWILGHCEWSTDVYLYNSSANSVNIEAMEVF